MSKEKKCMNCKRFGESDGRFYCLFNGKYHEIINSPEDCCNLWMEK